MKKCEIKSLLTASLTVIEIKLDRHKMAWLSEGQFQEPISKAMKDLMSGLIIVKVLMDITLYKA